MNHTTTSLLCLTLIAQPACAMAINVAPNGSVNATLADIKNNPNAAVSLAQAPVLLKEPTLRTPSTPVGASAAGEPVNSKEPFALITNGLAGTASRDLFGKVAA